MKLLIALISAFALQLLPDACAEEFLKVGVITSLTGPAADFGLSIRNSFQLAIEDHPERFSRIKFIYEDAGFDTKRAVDAFQKLVHVDKVQIVHTYGLSFCQALAPLAETEKIPLIAECLDTNASKGRPHVIRFFNNSDEVMALQTAWLKRSGFQRIGIIVADTAYLEEMSLALKRNLDPSQKIVFEEQVLPSESEFRIPIQKARRSKADIIGVFLSTGQIGTFYRQAKNLHLTLPTFGTTWFESLNELEQASGLINGAAFVSIAATPYFSQRYHSTYRNASALAFAAPAYEFAALLGELFGSTKSISTSEKILESLASVQFRRGTALESFRYIDSPSTGKYFQLPIAVKKISIDQVEILETVVPSDKSPESNQ